MRRKTAVGRPRAQVRLALRRSSGFTRYQGAGTSRCGHARHPGAFSNPTPAGGSSAVKGA